MTIAQQQAMRREWKAFRKRFNYTQQTLADTLGVSKRTVQYIETGTQTREEWVCVPRQSTLAKFKQLKKKRKSNG